tara:strand:- start:1096 stop:1269 length:174 start_codon:yes stop_codon:yes gene_type:complete
MTYTVIFADYQNNLKTEIFFGAACHKRAYTEAKQEFGTVIALITGNQLVYTKAPSRA